MIIKTVSVSDVVQSSTPVLLDHPIQSDKTRMRGKGSSHGTNVAYYIHSDVKHAKNLAHFHIR